MKNLSKFFALGAVGATLLPLAARAQEITAPTITVTGDLPVDIVSTGAFAGITAAYFIVMVAFYVYSALCFRKYAMRTNTPNSWMAWVPVLQIFLFIKSAGHSYWWFLAFFVPLLNIGAMIYLYSELAGRLNKPRWLAWLLLVPVANIIMPGYLAFAD